MPIPKKKSIYVNPDGVAHAHTYTSSKAIATLHCASSWVRSVCHNLSRIRQSWDICEHCVPVNAITHYPLSLPAQAEWLHPSLPLSPSLSFLPCVFVILFMAALLPLFVIYSIWIMCKMDVQVSTICFQENWILVTFVPFRKCCQWLSFYLLY